MRRRQRQDGTVFEAPRQAYNLKEMKTLLKSLGLASLVLGSPLWIAFVFWQRWSGRLRYKPDRGS